MEINNKKVKTIRPMTDSEKKECLGINYNTDSILFCVELETGEIIYPGYKCVTSMENESCLLNFINYSFKKK